MTISSYFRTRVNQARGDSGVALVAAMGVALIGMMVASLVIAQTIMAANDSGRDRLRTTEVHSAEAAIDATMALLETSAPCTVSPESFGGGVQATTVTIDIEYFTQTSTTPIACSGGVLAESPARATVRATSVGVQDSVGLNPERTMEASLTLVPNSSVSNQAAIFSADSLKTSSGLVLSPQLLDQNADVWVDKGGWYCNVPALITGGLYVPDGGLQFNKGCYVTGDTYVENTFSISGADKTKETVGGDLTVRSGNLQQSGPGASIKVGGKVLVGGSHDTCCATVTSGGSQVYNAGAASITDIASVGLPQIPFSNAEFNNFWAPLGFVKGTKNDLKNQMIIDWNIKPNENWRSGPLDTCQYQGWISNGLPVKLPADRNKKVVYDLRACNTVLFNNDLTVELYNDTAFIVKNFNSTGNIKIISGDGKKHKFWVISPIAGDGYTPGNITSSPELTVSKPIETFWYTPLTLELKSSSAIIGQVYGGKVTMASPVSFEYTDVGVPGRDLVSAVQTGSGFKVELLYKREVS